MARSEDSAYAENLADRFAALEVVPHVLRLQERNITVSHKMVPQSCGFGVAPRHVPGAETIAVVPLAEDKDDLVLTVREEAGRTLIGYGVHKALNPAEKFVRAMEVGGAVDIAVAPEFVMPEEEAEKIPSLLPHSGTGQCRLIIAGSGVTRSRREDVPWNETQVFNGLGTELWRQRKLWPAAIDANRARMLGIGTSRSGLLYEDTAAGDEIVVVDIEGLGRCAVLICQDIQGRPLMEELLRVFQPDWVFSPILDPGIKMGKWAHQRVFALSPISQTRYVVACSTTLSRLMGEVDVPACALVVGPHARTDVDEGRCLQLAAVGGGSLPRYVTIQWRAGAWQKSKMDCE